MFSVLLMLVPFGAPAGNVGLWRYNLDVVRGGKPRASKTLRGFDSFSRALALQMWNVFFLFLWSLPAAALYLIGILIGLATRNLRAAAVIMLIVGIIAALWSIFIAIYKQAQYMFSFAILADHPELTAKQCLDASVELSAPYVGSIVVAMLSFIGWLILSGLTWGIAGMLYVFPYMNLTWADIYCQIVPREHWGSAGGSGHGDPPQKLRQAEDNMPASVRAQSAAGSVRGIAGYYTGYQFPLGDGESISIGRDSKLAQIVFADSEDSRKISRLHCTVSFSASRGVYTVTDKSSNGTFRADGSQLPPNTPAELSRGTAIYLGSPDNSFRLE
jgi:hypothetical protein